MYLEKNGGLSLVELGISVPPPRIVIPFTYLALNFWNNKAFLQQKYLQEGLSIEQLVTLTGSSKHIVKRRLSQFGLTTMRIRLRNRSLAKDRSITEIKRLQSSGLTMRAIAKEMVSLGYPNLKGGKTWHPMMVSRLLHKPTTEDHGHAGPQPS